MTAWSVALLVLACVSLFSVGAFVVALGIGGLIDEDPWGIMAIIIGLALCYVGLAMGLHLFLPL